MRAPPKTFADYAAMAVCPILIMLAVGSLVFFLLEIGYGGSHTLELRWTLFWFVLAMVLVSRIAILRGYDAAGVYGVCLAAATSVMLMRYAAMNVLVWGLLALIWWATNKLTWDCTVIDDEVDASGEGLLRAARLDGGTRSAPAAAPVSPSRHAGIAVVRRPPGLPVGKPPPGKPRPVHGPGWQRWFGKSSADAKQPHAPGLWVIYFSLATVPLFGLGQALIPRGDGAGREYAFALFGLYLASALGLLMVSSFLGLRRYLRQRRLEMPATMSAAWIALGAALATAIMGVAILLPRPEANWSLTAMVDRLGDPRRISARPESRDSQPAADLGQAETNNEERGATATDSPETNQLSGGSVASNNAQISASGKAAGGQPQSGGRRQPPEKPRNPSNAPLVRRGAPQGARRLGCHLGRRETRRGDESRRTGPRSPEDLARARRVPRRSACAIGKGRLFKLAAVLATLWT